MIYIMAGLEGKGVEHGLHRAMGKGDLQEGPRLILHGVLDPLGFSFLIF